MAMQARTLSILGMVAATVLASCGGGGGGGGGRADSASLTAPAAFADGLSGTIELRADAPAGVDAVEFQLDGVTIATDADPPYTASIDTALHASGQHVLRVRGLDTAGTPSDWASRTVRFGGDRAAGAGFERQSNWVAGLSNATAFARTPDGRLLVAQQGGALRVVDAAGTLLATPFVTLAGVDSSGERGLIGVAVDPAFAGNGYVYLHYTRNQGGVSNNRVSRFVAQGNVAGPAGEQVLLELPPLSSNTNHNGGALHFGADGKLYVAVGDNDIGAQAADTTVPFGKLLRIDADGSVPGDNPAFPGSGNDPRVWAYGLRNPFTFAVRPEDGRIHINDVGEQAWEEINLGDAGADYGWPSTEGPTNAPGVTGPLFAYRQIDTSPPGSGTGGFFTGRAIAGGTFYPQSGNFPERYHGNYFFADFLSRFVAVLDLANGNAAYSFGSVEGLPVDMLVGGDGALYVLTRDGITRFVAQ